MSSIHIEVIGLLVASNLWTADDGFEICYKENIRIKMVEQVKYETLQLIIVGL